ncbi:hypothetical protein SARC_12172 [Sphaeroforma arctica JP610]|uniref:Uncharacterized protein n=1 Tax=Sphaeroforma arctica JP610 TaxID=667725 RepID=A0A0L0FEV2_9EUKA|nr:hypothetical protein SARC_12172 [Sphaeroforma arctica JP610]KNC75302.1 hypothetical protein SARC_12172 [Sphaeroforma arctica JP610]|eukprot:XP_014149204.1 hypothetical protein SARC_12172 [Sphaeroforma arctica JP610]
MLLDTFGIMERTKKLQSISEDFDVPKNAPLEAEKRRPSQQQLQKPWSAFEVAKAVSVLGAGTGVGIATVTVTTIVATVFIFVMLVVFVFFVLRNVVVGSVSRLSSKPEIRMRREHSNVTVGYAATQQRGNNGVQKDRGMQRSPKKEDSAKCAKSSWY